jgi:hypothetical protein
VNNSPKTLSGYITFEICAQPVFGIKNSFSVALSFLLNMQNADRKLMQKEKTTFRLQKFARYRCTQGCFLPIIDSEAVISVHTKISRRLV